ncbi:MAG: hypothetical protein FJ244_04595 [Nitrospira sp.]|nr:hypothetical protein [Nitrospira sp.]
MVDRILAAKAQDAEADASALEREIDQLVYVLYGQSVFIRSVRMSRLAFLLATNGSNRVFIVTESHRERA